MTENNKQRRPSIARWQVIAVALIFTSPFIVARLLYANLDHWAPEPTKNGGQLVSPAQPLPENLNAEFAALLNEHWTLVYVAGNDCAEVCREQLYNMRQARMAQGRQMHRIQGLLLSQAAMPETTQAFLAKEHEGLLQRQLDSDTLLATAAWLSIDGQASAPNSELVYLLDPLGNLMMVYPRALGARAILDDLSRLLKLSHIG